MPKSISKQFRFNVPSVIEHDFLFEFDVAIVFDEYEGVFVMLRDTTLGTRSFTLCDTAEVWQVLLFVWNECRKMAFNYVVETNKEEAKNLARLAIVLEPPG